MVGQEVGLDESDRALFEHDQIEVGRLASLDRREVVLDDLVEAFASAPPSSHMLPLKPLVQERQISSDQSPEAERRGHRLEPSRKEGERRRQQSREGVRRAGATFVHTSDRLSASAYNLSVMLRPTCSPCSAQPPPY